MTKSELIKALARKHKNLYIKDITLLVDTIFNEISKALGNENRVEIRGFGAFSIRKRKPRVARNPKTSETVYLGERSVVYFRAGKDMRDRVNNDNDSNTEEDYGNDVNDGNSEEPYSSPTDSYSNPSSDTY